MCGSTGIRRLEGASSKSCRDVAALRSLLATRAASTFATARTHHLNKVAAPPAGGIAYTSRAVGKFVVWAYAQKIHAQRGLLLRRRRPNTSGGWRLLPQWSDGSSGRCVYVASLLCLLSMGKIEGGLFCGLVGSCGFQPRVCFIAHIGGEMAKRAPHLNL